MTLRLSDFSDLCDLAREFNEWVPPERVHAPAPSEAAGERPGDDFNRRADWADLLKPLGWRVERANGPVTYWTRPGKDRGVSATTGKCHTDGRGDLLFVFTSSAAPLDPDTAYSKFAVYTLTEHGGDYAAATRSLRSRGYGADRPSAEPVFGTIPLPPAEPGRPAEPDEWPLDDLLAHDFGEAKFIVKDLIADESVTILGGVQKGGKSWMALQISQCVAAGEPFLGRETVAGPVLYLALEDGGRRLKDRLKKQRAGMGDPKAGLPMRLRFKQLKLDTAEGQEKLIEYAARRPRLLIIDTLAAAKGGKTDESDSGLMADLFNGLRSLAQTYKVAILVVHHHGKYVSGDPAHDLRGSTAIGAAADVLLGLYRVRRRKGGEAAQHGGGFDPDDDGGVDFYLKARGRDIEDVTIKVTFGAKTDWQWKECDPAEPTLAPVDPDQPVNETHRALIGLGGTATTKELAGKTGLTEYMVKKQIKEAGSRVAYRTVFIDRNYTRQWGVAKPGECQLNRDGFYSFLPELDGPTTTKKPPRGTHTGVFSSSSGGLTSTADDDEKSGTPLGNGGFLVVVGPGHRTAELSLLLDEEGPRTLAELAARTGESEDDIRRDLEPYLEEGLIVLKDGKYSHKEEGK